MKVLHVTETICKAYGGPSRSITGLCRGLSHVDGMEVGLFVHDPTEAQIWDVGNARVYSGGARFGDVLNDFRPDLVHTHGIWFLNIHRDVTLCRKYGIPYVMAARGSLDAWSLRQKWLKKKIALFVYQMKDLKKAIALHATSEQEKMHLRKVGLTQNVILSPNGINMPKELPCWNRAADGRRKVVFLSRIHAKKGLLELVRAWSSVAHDGWELLIAGNNDEDYWKVIEDEIRLLNIGDSVQYVGAMDDSEKWNYYRKGDVFVLPSYTENFGIVIAEALHAGLPVITTTNTPWQLIAQVKAGEWIDLTQENLIAALRRLMSASDVERMEMGGRGKRMVDEVYDWERIAGKLVEDYRRLV